MRFRSGTYYTTTLHRHTRLHMHMVLQCYGNMHNTYIFVVMTCLIFHIFSLLHNEPDKQVCNRHRNVYAIKSNCIYILGVLPSVKDISFTECHKNRYFHCIQSTLMCFVASIEQHIYLVQQARNQHIHHAIVARYMKTILLIRLSQCRPLICGTLCHRASVCRKPISITPFALTPK